MDRAVSSFSSNEVGAHLLNRGVEKSWTYKAAAVLKRNRDHSLHRAWRKHCAQQSVAQSIRTGCILGAGLLCLSNAPPEMQARPVAMSGEIQISIQSDRSENSYADGTGRMVGRALRCRSSTDGSFRELVDAVQQKVSATQVEHIVTDIFRVGDSELAVVMMYKTKDWRGLEVVREARAAMDLTTCTPSDLSV